MGNIDKKVEYIGWLMVGVIIILLVGFITLYHRFFSYNSITYKEYSNKLEQYQKNQQLIIDLENQLLKK